MAIKVRQIDENGIVKPGCEGTQITDAELANIVYKDDDNIKFETGKIKFTNTGIQAHNWKGIYGTTANDDNWVIRGSQTGYNEGYLEIATGDDGTEPIYVSQYGINGATNCYDVNMSNSNRRTATLLDSSGNTNFPGILSEKGARVYSANNKPTASDIGAIPTTRKITINGITQDLSADRSWNISGGGGTQTGGGIQAESNYLTSGQTFNVYYKYYSKIFITAHSYEQNPCIILGFSGVSSFSGYKFVYSNGLTPYTTTKIISSNINNTTIWFEGGNPSSDLPYFDVGFTLEVTSFNDDSEFWFIKVCDIFGRPTFIGRGSDGYIKITNGDSPVITLTRQETRIG